MFWWLYFITSLILGASVGSFLNVAIYRIPRGLSVNSPKRSFCPSCKKPIPWFRNIPILTWIFQKGKCHECGSGIAVRYVLVELLTALLFGLGWILFPNLHAILIFIFVFLLVGISFIDIEHLLIPVDWTWWGAGIAFLLSAFLPQIVLLDGLITLESFDFISGFQHESAMLSSLLGWGFGYGLLIAIVLFGKLAFGKKVITLDEKEGWKLKEPETDEEELEFHLDAEHLSWSELFYRKSDKLIIETESIELNGKALSGEKCIITQEEIIINDQHYSIAELTSLSGTTKKITIPREAMGAGDPPLLAMIGAFLGAPAVIFTLFSSSVFALLAALLGKLGMGQRLPYGPFLALGGLTWLFGGWKLWNSYLNIIGF